MPNAFSRSWEITKLSFSVIRQDKELLLFPFLAGIFSITFILAMLFPTLIALVFKGIGMRSAGALQYALWFVAYFGLAFIATFFNVCVVYTAKVRFKGGNATFWESIKFALSRIHIIFYWSILSATMGIILRILDNMAERAGKGGKILLGILSSVLGMAWSIITIFVVPGMVYNNLGPIGAIKKSMQILRKTWGESLIRHFGLGLVELVFFVAGIIISIPLVLVAIGMGIYGILFAVLLIIIYFITVGIVFSIANSIFNTALYVYADTGKIPKGYSKDVMANAFKSRK